MDWVTNNQILCHMARDFCRNLYVAELTVPCFLEILQSPLLSKTNKGTLHRLVCEMEALLALSQMGANRAPRWNTFFVFSKEVGSGRNNSVSIH